MPISLLLLSLLPADDKKDPNAADRQRLQGTWITSYLVNDGKTIIDSKTPAKGPETKLVYEADKWLIKVGDKTVASGVFTIDATKSLKEIDILDGSGKINDKTRRGIYTVDGDVYKYCLAKTGDPRPTDFTADKGSSRSLGLMKRGKSKKPDPKETPKP